MQLDKDVRLSRLFRDTSYLRLSVTDMCDLRCVYCMPSCGSVAHSSVELSLREISVLVDAFARNGITKVRLTGGEPLVRNDIREIIKLVADTSAIAVVGLTTNGVRLADMASDLARAGLQRINISLDSLDRDTFFAITGKDALDEVLNGIDVSLRCGFEAVKINTVVMRGVNDSEIPAIASLAMETPVDVRFIELMPLGYSASEWQSKHVPAAEIRAILGGLEAKPAETGSSARNYSNPGWKGIVGIISPMSEQFCDRCNRMRLTSSGKLKPCLRLPIEEDIRHLVDTPDLVEKLGTLMGQLSCHKLSIDSAATSAIQSKTMCSIGG